jgi:hypothetical protein
MSASETSASSSSPPPPPTLTLVKVNNRNGGEYVLCTLITGHAKYKYTEPNYVYIYDGNNNTLCGIEYDGNWENGIRNGVGKMTFYNNSTYEGEWKDGLMNGFGKMTTYFRSGRVSQVREGTWRNGMEDGEISIDWHDGRKFKGNFVLGQVPFVLPDGKPNMVKMIYPQPDKSTKVYEGELWRDFSYTEYKQRDEKSKVEKAKDFISGILQRKPTTTKAAGEEMTSFRPPGDSGVPPSDSGGSNSRMKRRQSKR